MPKKLLLNGPKLSLATPERLTSIYTFLTNFLIVTVTMMRDKVLAFHQKQKVPHLLYLLCKIGAFTFDT